MRPLQALVHYTDISGMLTMCTTMYILCSMTTVISIRLDKDLKEAAQEVAKSVGIPLSTLIGAYLHQIVATRQINLYAPEQMTPHLEKMIEEAEKEETIGPFSTVEEFLADLEK